MTPDINREIYNKYYSDHNVRLQPRTAYDRWMVDFRFSLIDRYGTGRDVLDLGCGTGSYLIPVLDRVRSAIGVDYSANMLAGFRRNLQGRWPAHLCLLEADAAELPLAPRSVDFVYSYTALYHVSRVRSAIREVGRVLRPGGYAALELGNLYSLNTVVCLVQHRRANWARPFHIPYGHMFRYLREAGLDVVERRTFQLLTMYGVPRPLFFLYPLSGPFWKRIMGRQVGGRLLDEWISGSWPLRYLAFRHMFICQRA